MFSSATQPSRHNFVVSAIEMRSKVNFGHPKWPTAAIMTTFFFKVAYRSEMAINVIQIEFRTFKMGAGGHFVNKIALI